MNSYTTLKNEAKTELVEKKSIFYGYACPVNTEDDAIAFVNKIRKKHSDATHNVYAYRLRDNNITRFSDDGEPHGTAGLPVLDVLRKEDIIDAVIVVTRYFGGTLLGAGGLVRAYSAAAKLAVDEAVKVKSVLHYIFELTIEYSELKKIEFFLKENNISIINTDYTEKIKISASVRADLFDKIKADIYDQSNGKICIEKSGETYNIG
ncbi:YigZ family protein [Eubacteriales bacterium OttesenSCG-928-G02]|nr:YigZ family protein [Eubacteriales bacterium OttesenSCG-928-G02]